MIAIEMTANIGRVRPLITAFPNAASFLTNGTLRTSAIKNATT